MLSGRNKGAFSKSAVTIATLSVALGVIVMIIAVATVTGFKKEIANKVIGFGAHIQISNFDSYMSLVSEPIEKDRDFYPALQSHNQIEHIQVFATKPGIIKTDDQIQGVIVKGISSDFDWHFFEERLVEGRIFKVNDTSRTNDIVISSIIARLLKIKLEDKIQIWFIQDPPRVRVFDVVGIYETGLEEFDLHYVIADIGHIQRLNNWTENQVSGIEIFIKDFEMLEEVDEFVYNEIGYDLYSKTIKDIYPSIFDWLDLLDINAVVILVIMLAVAAINMITTLLIIILERTHMIGVFKAIGMKNFSVRKIFMYYSSYILLKGLFWGNLVAVSLCLIQIQFGIISLPQESYFVATVPVNLQLSHLLLINAGTVVCTFLMLIGPSYITTRISPVKAIKFD